MKYLLCLLLVAWASTVQKVDKAGGGVGPVSRSAFIAWYGSNTTEVEGPPTLGLLVLWRGRPEWFAGWTFDDRGIHVGSRLLELRTDGSTFAVVGGQRIVLERINTILVDVGPATARIVKMLYIEPRMTGWGSADRDALLRSHPELAEFAQLPP
jgi:hypothetical protein